MLLVRLSKNGTLNLFKPQSSKFLKSGPWELIELSLSLDGFRAALYVRRKIQNESVATLDGGNMAWGECESVLLRASADTASC